MFRLLKIPSIIILNLRGSASVSRPKSFITEKPKRCFLKFTHSTAWKWDKVAVILMFPVIPVSFFLMDKVTDSILAGLTAFHMHR